MLNIEFPADNVNSVGYGVYSDDLGFFRNFTFFTVGEFSEC